MPSESSARIEDLLAEAARAAVHRSIPINVFILAAQAAYLRADPALAQRVFDQALLEQFEALRRAGRLSVA
jgi:hypothetical protein